MTQAQAFLDEAYDKLDLRAGDLVATTLSPTDKNWVEKGDWATLAKHVGADRVLFVQDNPVVVFAKQDSEDPEALRELFSSVWCMSRPNLLFLASPGSLAVYDLSQAPARSAEEWNKTTPLDIVHQVSEVAEKLQAYHRAQIESGKLFEEGRFGEPEYRADKSLIQDLRTVRASLMDHGLSGEKLKYAHALIGRSIFIRYLEDREILTSDYFLEVAKDNQEWQAILSASPKCAYVPSAMGELSYVKVLDSKGFCYALFKRLAKDFNGDMFPEDAQEEQHVHQEHLKLLQGFLRGDTDEQRKLFFWAYKFDIIPIELVSSIYEEFYSATNDKKDEKGTHYTPPALVDFLLSQLLTQDCLTKNPVVLDPACGSGIFLVEAFRRIVRHRVQKQQGRRLRPQELRKILREQIRGIDLNEEAIRVAAFSLYLALLHYQEPKDILKQITKGYRLPCLVKQDTSCPTNTKSDYFDILQAENAFAPKTDMLVDIVVGNPPWGADKQDQIPFKWCASQNYPVGNKERSQAFIWRATSFLKEEGCAGLLVSSGILHKTASKSKDFRKHWLKESSLEHVAHFAGVRNVFFANAIAPFAAVLFKKKRPGIGTRFQYSSAKMSAFVKTCQAVLLTKNDIHWLKQDDFLHNDTLWKTYWFGGRHDAVFLANLKAYPALIDLKGAGGNLQVITGRGFQKSGGKLKPSAWLRDYRILPTKAFTRAFPVSDATLLEVPEHIHRHPKTEIIQGPRILFLQGIQQASEPKGQLFSRFETKDYCFEKSIYGISLIGASSCEYQILLGILWSSLVRYYFFLTCSQWGTWNYQVLLDELRELPVAFPKDQKTQGAISKAVKALQQHYQKPLANPAKEALLQKDLDDAVFDAYAMSPFERDLVRDTCGVSIPLFYDPVSSPGARPLDLSNLPARIGLVDDVKVSPNNRIDICAYLETFLGIWNRELEPAGEFFWQLIAPDNPAPMLALVFSTQTKGTTPTQQTQSDNQVWRALLKKMAHDFRVPFHSDRIYVDALLRVVSPTEIIIIKRNEGRLWTRSAAREDAEATFLKAIHLNESSGESS